MNPLAFIPAPYRLLAMAALFLFALGGAYLQGRSDGKNTIHAQALRAMKKGLKAIEIQRVRIAGADARAAAAERSRQTIVREVYREIPTIIDRPVYQRMCLDADGVRLIDRATATANGFTPAKPSGGAAHAP